MKNYDRAEIIDRLESIGIVVNIDTVDVSSCRRTLGLKWWGMIDFLIGLKKYAGLS